MPTAVHHYNNYGTRVNHCALRRAVRPSNRDVVVSSVHHTYAEGNHVTSFPLRKNFVVEPGIGLSCRQSTAVGTRCSFGDGCRRLVSCGYKPRRPAGTVAAKSPIEDFEDSRYKSALPPCFPRPCVDLKPENHAIGGQCSRPSIVKIMASQPSPLSYRDTYTTYGITALVRIHHSIELET